MNDAENFNNLYFRSGPIFLLLSWYILFKGYNALWSTYFDQNSQALAASLAIGSVALIFFLARYFERLITEFVRSPSWIKGTITAAIAAILFVFSALGVANALYYTVAGRHVIEGGVEKLVNGYTLLASETQAMAATPAFDAMTKRLEVPIANLEAEIRSVNCGIGSGAENALRDVEKVLSNFRRLNIPPGRMPRCDNRAAYEQLARDYRAHIQSQLLNAPEIKAEDPANKIKFRTFMDEKYALFRKEASSVIEAVNEAARGVNLFGSRDGFNEPVRQLIELNEQFVNDRALAVQKAAAIGGSYSLSARRPIDMEQEKSLGGLSSLYLALIHLNPWYVVLFFFAAIVIDAFLVLWVFYTRTRVFSYDSTSIIGEARNRVRYLWTPPTIKREEQA